MPLESQMSHSNRCSSTAAPVVTALALLLSLQASGWMEDYNENDPHSGLEMRSPREFIQSPYVTTQPASFPVRRSNNLCFLSQTSPPQVCRCLGHRQIPGANRFSVDYQLNSLTRASATKKAHHLHRQVAL